MPALPHIPCQPSDTAVRCFCASCAMRRRPLWWVRLTQWEYWGFWYFYLPIYCYYAWLSLRARSLLFFTAANTNMPYGGLVGEHKSSILAQLPTHLVPTTVLLPAGSTLQQAMQHMQQAGLQFPIIAKPNVGERGRWVEKIDDAGQLQQYLVGKAEQLLLQTYVDWPLELGVMYTRMPGFSQGRVTSVVVKGFLQVMGTGRHTLEELVLQNDRARFQLPTLRIRYAALWLQIVPAGQQLLLVPIGNHSRGTTFYNGNQHITPALEAAMQRVADAMPGFHFGRFDLRTPSIAAFCAGQMMILEVNGVSSEPGHIYDPAMPLLRAYRDLFRHWRLLYHISRAQHARGVPYAPLGTVLALTWRHFRERR